MKLNCPFNQFQKETYFEVIENHKSYSDFNTLGLYRSLTENELLSTEERIEIRDFAHGFFQKTFDFLQLKDPITYFKVTHLGSYKDYYVAPSEYGVLVRYTGQYVKGGCQFRKYDFVRNKKSIQGARDFVQQQYKNYSGLYATQPVEIWTKE